MRPDGALVSGGDSDQGQSSCAGDASSLDLGTAGSLVGRAAGLQSVRLLLSLGVVVGSLFLRKEMPRSCSWKRLLGHGTWHIRWPALTTEPALTGAGWDLHLWDGTASHVREDKVPRLWHVTFTGWRKCPGVPHPSSSRSSSAPPCKDSPQHAQLVVCTPC